jgi:hypothetical protein
MHGKSYRSVSFFAALGLAATIVLVASPYGQAIWRTLCASRYPTVHFILPAGYRGPFVVASAVGEKVSRRFTGIQHEFYVPNDGVVLVEDDSVFHSWHFIVISTTDGIVVREGPNISTDRISKGLVFLSKGSSTDSVAHENWFYYGPPGGDTDIAALDRLDNTARIRILSNRVVGKSTE